MSKQSIVLHNQRNGSDKIYIVNMEEVSGGWIVNYRNGRRIRGSGYKIRGNAGGTHTRTPRSYDAALRIYQRLVREKLAQHYVVVEQTREGSFSEPEERHFDVMGDVTHSGRILMFPLDLAEIERTLQLCDNPSYCIQEEENGVRSMVLKEVNGDVRGIDRNGQYASLPDAIHKTPTLLRAESFLIDGELVGQNLRAWDLLEHDGEDLRDQPMRVRYERLCTLLPGYVNLPIRVVPTAFRAANKRTFLDEVRAGGGKGVVFKLVGAPYVEGETKYALKHTFRSTVMVQVVGADAVQHRVQIAVGSDEGARFVGNLRIPPDFSLPALGAIVEVEYLRAAPNTGLLEDARYRGPSTCDVDSLDRLHFDPDPAENAPNDFSSTPS